MAPKLLSRTWRNLWKLQKCLLVGCCGKFPHGPGGLLMAHVHTKGYVKFLLRFCKSCKLKSGKSLSTKPPANSLLLLAMATALSRKGNGTLR